MRRGIHWLFLLLVVLAILLRLYVFVCGLQNIPITGDEAITALQAKHILQGNFSLLVYAQPYEFPLETYFYMLLRVFFFPIRFQTLLVGIITTALFTAILLKAGKISDLLPAWIYLLFPSAYLLTTHFAYSTPHTTFSYIPPLLAIYLIFFYNRGDHCFKRNFLFFVSGILCGLAIAENFAVLSFVLPLYSAIFLNEQISKIKAFTVFAIGTFIGLMPFFLAKWIYPDAYGIVSQTVPLLKALKQLRIILFYSLPKALGIAPPLYPDTDVTLNFGTVFMLPVAYLFIALLLFATFVQMNQWVLALIRERAIPKVTIYDIFLLAIWIGLIGAMFNSRFSSHNFRYLHPLTYGSPFLIAFFTNIIPQTYRKILTLCCIVLALFNVITTIKLCEEWKKESFKKDVVGAPEIFPVIDFLKTHNIKYAVATHWQCYRLNYFADEEIICTQPWNERFPCWQLPYKEKVNSATNVAIIFETRKNRYGFNFNWFAKAAAERDIVFNSSNVGDFIVCWNFKCEARSFDASRLNKISIKTIIINNEFTNTLWLYDGRRDNSHNFYFKSTNFFCSLNIYFVHPTNIQQINIFYSPKKQIGYTIAKIIYKNSLGNFEEVATSDYLVSSEPFIFENNHPQFGFFVQKIILNKVIRTDSIILEGKLILPSDKQAPFTEIECYY